MFKIKTLFVLSTLAVPVLFLSACQTSTTALSPQRQQELEFNATNFLNPQPESLKDYGWKFQSDIAAHDVGIGLRQGARGQMAYDDAGEHEAVDHEKKLTEVLGFEISENATPVLHALLVEINRAGDEAVDHVKLRFKRPRPILTYTEDQTCRPETLHKLRTKKGDKSYPSGHTTSAWIMGLTVAAVIPEKADIILKREFEAGESRWICGAHWASDVEFARYHASTIFALRAGNPAFQNQLNRARAEILSKYADLLSSH